MCQENNRLLSSRKEATHTDRTVQHTSLAPRQECRRGWSGWRWWGHSGTRRRHGASRRGWPAGAYRPDEQYVLTSSSCRPGKSDRAATTASLGERPKRVNIWLIPTEHGL